METIDLLNKVKSNNINDLYDLLDYDYSKEIEYEKTGAFEEKHSNFIQLFKWKYEPYKEMILRVFNQINTYYAEDFAFKNLNEDASKIITNCSDLILFRQGKKLGFRNHKISYGIRKNIDRADPISNYNWLYGLAPDYINSAIQKWEYAIDNVKPSSEIALVLTMVIIGIHPFTDGNGRISRIIFNWLHKRWKLNDLYLNEGGDGELLRTGDNIYATEHLMGAFILEMFGRFVEVPYGFREFQTVEDEKKAFEAISNNLENIIKNQDYIMGNEHFIKLFKHLKNDNHIIDFSPRFKCLDKIINNGA